MLLRLDGFVLRPVQPKDAEALAKAANHREIAQQLRDRFPHPYAVRDAVEWIRSLDLRPPATVFVFEFAGAAVGVIGLVLGTDVHARTAELGYWLGRDHWGKGWTTQAVRAIARHAFAELGMHRVFAHVFSSNPGSRRVLEKAGFVHEGTLRRSVIKAGQELDQWVLAALEGEWSG